MLGSKLFRDNALVYRVGVACGLIGLVGFIAGCPVPPVDLCAGVTCDDGFACDADTGDCVEVPPGCVEEGGACELPGALCCDGLTCDEDVCVTAEPDEFANADAARGGLLYDKWWKVADVDEPTEDHPFWATQDTNTRTGADTWRCKECHGWDYKGAAGAYATGSHATGFAGIFETTLSAQEAFDLISDDHGFGGAGLTEGDIWDLAKFVLEGQVDNDDFMDADGLFTGDAAAGNVLYDEGIGTNTACGACHGADGLTIPPGADADHNEWIGEVANDNPWEFLHKLRFGQPGAAAMPAAVDVDASDTDLADLGAYSQTLPTEPGAGGPTLKGVDADKSIILPFTVQAAYNDDTMFVHMSWEADRGDTHDYFRYTNGAWQREGGTRRDAQATIDNDPLRGSTSVNSTIYESRVTFMLDDPNGPNAVDGFAQFGCMLTCHDDSRAMPLWVNDDGEVHKYLNDDRPGRLDLWHHRLGRANHLAESDDQWVGTRVGDEGDGKGGSRHGDDGTGPYKTASFDDGTPQWVFDPATSGGVYAFPFEDLFTSPLRFFVDETGADLGPNAPNAVGIDYADAVTMGYAPSEGDTVPRRRLRQTAGSRGDISADGTTFTPSADDPLMGRWNSNIQRALDTGNDDDTALADGGVYNIAFAVHTGMVTVRDHYVSFSYTLSLAGGDADIQAVKLSGSGKDSLPDFSDTTQFPATEIDLFLPGITSYEFLVGENAGLEYIDPATGMAVDQGHGGATFLLDEGLGCRACHTVDSGEAFNPPQDGGFNGGAMETLTLQRGGIVGPTPIPPSGG